METEREKGWGRHWKENGLVCRKWDFLQKELNKIQKYAQKKNVLNQKTRYQKNHTHIHTPPALINSNNRRENTVRKIIFIVVILL